MSDLIHRSDVDKLLNQTIALISSDRKRVLPDIAYDAMRSILEEFRNELSSIESVDEWIPVTERFPEVGNYILCLNSRRNTQNVCQYIGDGYFEYAGEYEMNPTHWKYLPSNPTSHDK